MPLLAPEKVRNSYTLPHNCPQPSSPTTLLPLSVGTGAAVGSARRMFETRALAEREELGSNILHLETPEIQIGSLGTRLLRLASRLVLAAVVWLALAGGRSGARVGPSRWLRG